MKRIVWLTDLHLSFVDPQDRQPFVDEVAAAHADAFLIGGDIGEAKNVIPFLENWVAVFEVPTFVVLGNHDFYGGGIGSVRSALQGLAERCESLTYLTAADRPVQLTDRLGLIGHDGWADGREGDYGGSQIMMNDYRLIKELACLSKSRRLTELHRLGDEAAEHIRRQLALALPAYEEVFLLTHVPPLREACWYQGRISDDEWAPHFVCQAMGRAILEMAEQFPDKQITVLCGHTHSAGTCAPADNVHVITGAAQYGQPGITQLFEVA